ncbi:MAG: sigma 54-interacting transcriptional regulator, partial [Fidelibacterota bacterium]
MIRVLIIGGGKGGSALLDIFRDDPTVRIVGLADVKRDVPAYPKCQEEGIPFSTDYLSFLGTHELDLVVDVTGDKEFYHQLKSRVPGNTELIGGKSARIIWELISTKKETQILQEKIGESGGAGGEEEQQFIVGTNVSMVEIAKLIDKVAPTPTSVLIRGETGTGKEVIAREIYRKSYLSERPFVVINCTALPTPLIESELFGHKKGSFTGATEDKIGLLERAERGTVFLDEIADMQLDLQARLLRFLQSGELRRVGDTS